MLGDGSTRQSALVLLAGLPFFYLLVFSSETEESEVEIACLCAVLGVSLYQLRLRSSLGEQFDKLVFLLPAAIYYVYTTYVLRDLTVFKHTLRGYGYLSARRPDYAAAFFARAVQLAPGHTLANQGLRKLLAGLDYDKLPDSTAVLLPPRSASRSPRRRCSATPRYRRRSRPPGACWTSWPGTGPSGRRAPNTARRRPDARRGLRPRGRHTLAPPRPRRLARVAGRKPAARAVRGVATALAQHPELSSRLGEAELAKPGRRVGALQGEPRRNCGSTPPTPARPNSSGNCTRASPIRSTSPLRGRAPRRASTRTTSSSTARRCWPTNRATRRNWSAAWRTCAWRRAATRRGGSCCSSNSPAAPTSWGAPTRAPATGARFAGWARPSARPTSPPSRSGSTSRRSSSSWRARSRAATSPRRWTTSAS